MNITLSIFLISLILIIGLLLFKIWEIRKGVELSKFSWRFKTDLHLDRVSLFFKELYFKKKNFLVLKMQYIRERLHSLFLHVADLALVKARRYIDTVKGKRSLEQHHHLSSYWQMMKSHKKISKRETERL
jgi:hypothetical protein